MDQDKYRAITQRLQDYLEAQSDVVGLVALGSMAGTERQPDQWSDHDFFVITETGAQQAYRDSVDWLPFPEKIVLHFQETDHGCKAIYNDAHLLEYAIFDKEELHLARINTYRMLFDRANVSSIMPTLQQSVPANAFNSQKTFDTMISNILVGSMRANRGELMSAHTFVRQHALYAFLSLCWQELALGSPYHDNLDPFRRYEKEFPEIAMELDSIMQLPIQEAGLGLLKLCGELLVPILANPRREAIKTIRMYIQSNKH